MCRLLPLLAPARPIDPGAFDAALPPTERAPSGSPAIRPGKEAAGVPGVGSPVKKYPAREKPIRAVLIVAGEKMCVQSMVATCSRRLSTSVVYELKLVGVKSALSSSV